MYISIDFVSIKTFTDIISIGKDSKKIKETKRLLTLKRMDMLVELDSR